MVWLAVTAFRDGWSEADPLASVLGAGAGIGALLVTLRAQAGTGGVNGTSVPAPPAVPDWVVDREESERVVALLRRRKGSGSSVGIATGLHGAGGFGKTTLAHMVCAHPKVRRRFPGGVHVITIGRDVRGRAAIAAKVAEATRYVTGDTLEAGTDPDQAGVRLGTLLDRRPRTLLVLDDVWEAEQLTPFLHGGDRTCVRLITTRRPEVLPGGADRVVVDRMSQRQAEAVLSHGLSELEASLLQDLVLVTGRWALLLRMANQRLAAQAATGADLNEAARHLLARLQQRGPSGLDVLPGPVVALDLDDPRRRNQAVRASIEAATTLLPSEGARRFAELGIFAEDETIPVGLICRLWQATAGLHEMESRALCKQMADLSLLSLDARITGGTITIHDVVRDYLRSELGTELGAVNALFVDAVAQDVPWDSTPTSETGQVRAWWEMGDGYLLDHLIEHMVEAGLHTQAQEVASDLRWVRVRLHQRGPTAPWSDLSLVPTSPARLMARELGRAAPLLTPTQPAQLLDGVLHDRLANVLAWHEQAARLSRGGTVLVGRNTPPDLPDPYFTLELPGDSTPTAVGIAPDGRHVATGHASGAVRVWEVGTGRLLRVLSGPRGRVHALAITSDALRLAAVISREVSFWDLRDGQCRQQQLGIYGGFREGTALAVSDEDIWVAYPGDALQITVRGLLTGTYRAVHDTRPPLFPLRFSVSSDGRWLAVAREDRTLCIWDTHRYYRDGELPRVLNRYQGGASAVAVSGDRRHLATAHPDRSIRIWDTTDNVGPRVFTGLIDPVTRISTSPDFRWLAAAGEADPTVHVWDLSPPSPSISRGNPVQDVAVSPDGTWLVTANADHKLRVWDAVTGDLRVTITGRTNPIRSVTITPDGRKIISLEEGGHLCLWEAHRGTRLTQTRIGSGQETRASAVAPNAEWVATSTSDGIIRVWEASSGTRRHALSEHAGHVQALAVTPDSTTLVSIVDNSDLSLWSPTTGQLLRSLPGQRSVVKAMAISRDGRWIAGAGADQNVYLWDTTVNHAPRALTGHSAMVRSVAISPDGRWTASISADQSIRLWDILSGEPTALIRTTATLNSCVFSPHSTSLYVASSSGLFAYDIHDASNP
ncbi:NB-ARC domain-containing protein [Streptomyces sp. NPDC001930]|uniref:NB-ARC domain-containing protein n=1 Tax=Streptomyces sp. NPDC001930 TaxID=3364625 RepID=UPI0036A79D7D